MADCIHTLTNSHTSLPCRISEGEVIHSDCFNANKGDYHTSPPRTIKNVATVSPPETSPRRLMGTTTTLSQLMTERKYKEASRWLKDHPAEASIWVTTEDSNTAMHESYNQLPLHLACSHLESTANSMTRFQLEQLILQLVMIFPGACGVRDKGHSLPLHKAIWNNATPETISMLLMADPDSAYQKDQCGRNAAEINRHRASVFMEQVKDLLSLGKKFWEQARTQGMGNECHTRTVNDDNFLYSLCITTGEQNAAYDSSLTMDLESESTLSQTMNSIQSLALEFRPISPERKSIITDSATLSLASKYDLDGHGYELISGASIAEELSLGLYTVQKSISESRSLKPPSNERAPDCNAKGNFDFNKLSLEKHVLLKRLLMEQVQNHCSNPQREEPTNSNELIALRIQNAALKRKIEQLKNRKDKQAAKIRQLKSLVPSLTFEESLMSEYSDSESESTFSLLERSTINFVPSETDSEDYFSITGADQWRETSLSKSAIYDTPAAEDNGIQTGLASFRFRDFVTRLQRKVSPFPSKEVYYSCDEMNPIKSDNLEDLFCNAAEIYAEITKERPRTGANLILQWESSLA